MSSLQIRLGLSISKKDNAMKDLENEINTLKELSTVDTGSSQKSEADIKKSYCSVHHDQEIVFACYQCQKMCCQMCENKHEGHTKAFFKD